MTLPHVPNLDEAINIEDDRDKNDYYVTGIDRKVSLLTYS